MRVFGLNSRFQYNQVYLLFRYYMYRVTEWETSNNSASTKPRYYALPVSMVLILNVSTVYARLIDFHQICAPSANISTTLPC